MLVTIAVLYVGSGVIVRFAGILNRARNRRMEKT